MSRLVAYGGWGYAHTLTNVIPLFHNTGWDEEQVETLLVDNPARLLAIAGLNGDHPKNHEGFAKASTWRKEFL